MKPSERRSSVRLQIRIKADIAILAPDQTFTPYRREGEILDMSSGGVRLRLIGFERESYQALLRGRNYARIRAMLPGHERPSALHGEIKWIDYRVTENSPECLIGVFFGFLDETTRLDLERALSLLRIHRAEPADTPG